MKLVGTAGGHGGGKGGKGGKGGGDEGGDEGGDGGKRVPRTDMESNMHHSVSVDNADATSRICTFALSSYSAPSEDPDQKLLSRPEAPLISRTGHQLLPLLLDSWTAHVSSSSMRSCEIA